MSRRAFTLIEFMLVIALIGLAIALLLSGLEPMLPDARKDSPYETLRKAVDAAWYGAANNHGQYVLEYEPDAKTILVRPVREKTTTAAGITTDSPAPAESETQRFVFDTARVDSLEFLRPPDEGQGSLQNTVTTPFSRLYFSPWGGATPANIALTIKGQTFLYHLDPFGGALEELKK